MKRPGYGNLLGSRDLKRSAFMSYKSSKKPKLRHICFSTLKWRSVFTAHWSPENGIKKRKRATILYTFKRETILWAVGSWLIFTNVNPQQTPPRFIPVPPDQKDCLIMKIGPIKTRVGALKGSPELFSQNVPLGNKCFPWKLVSKWL